MKATWNGQVIAESDDIVEVEGNQYFPISSIKKEYFENSGLHTTCPWKGEASYYTVAVGGVKNENAAWYYPTPKEGGEVVTDKIAFWNGVEIS